MAMDEMKRNLPNQIMIYAKIHKYAIEKKCTLTRACQLLLPLGLLPLPGLEVGLLFPLPFTMR